MFSAPAESRRSQRSRIMHACVFLCVFMCMCVITVGVFSCGRDPAAPARDRVSIMGITYTRRTRVSTAPATGRRAQQLDQFRLRACTFCFFLFFTRPTVNRRVCVRRSSQKGIYTYFSLLIALLYYFRSRARYANASHNIPTYDNSYRVRIWATSPPVLQYNLQNTYDGRRPTPRRGDGPRPA